MTATGVIAGTPSYMSPEQAAGHGERVGPACDVYSLGAILYELLTGRPPFREENPLDTLMQVLSREPALPRRLNPKVPRALELICLKCLEKSPEDRYASAEALADDLEHFSQGRAPGGCGRRTCGQRFWRWARRQPALASRLGALGVFYVVETGQLRRRRGRSCGFHLKISALLAIWAAGLDRVPAVPRQPAVVDPGAVRLGRARLGGALAPCSGGRRGGQPAGGRLPAADRGLGLWFRVRFVWFMAGLSVRVLRRAGARLLPLAAGRTPRGFDTGVDRHVIFLLALVVEAATVSYLVLRLRTLSSYFRPGAVGGKW